MLVMLVMVMRGLAVGGLGRALDRGFDGGGFLRAMMGDGGGLMGMRRSLWLVYSVNV